ncbi:uncharacterized protein LOC131216040 [Anopheles bellator]|uniref:uncharacterized protein LOC131216040 n=1 Tax=Anopheles bellator TaxID=139047 RepID=UPI00264834BF|nr:uncharacterized protein LOC131216040 [Anopheles bellator]
MAYGFWRVLMKQCSKARLGMQNNSSSLGEDVSSNTRCTKSFDGQTWKVNESLNLSTNISSTSTTTIATDSCRHTVDLRMAGLKKVITMNADDCSSVNDRVCETLCRGEVRKSRSKMKSYLKRCKDVLSGGVNSTIFSNVSEELSSVQEIVAYQKIEVPTLQSSSTSCWYLEDHSVELRPEDNREPYSSLASARLKLETEEFRLEQEALANSKDTSETTVMIKSSSTMQEIVNTEADACMAVPQDDLKHCQIETVANENSSFANIDIKLKIHHQEQQDSTQLLSGSLSSAHRCIERLIDQCLGPLYPEYVDHTRPILIRQARDLLVCIYHGDLERFETQFLRPATDIVRKLRCVYQQGKMLHNGGTSGVGEGVIQCQSDDLGNISPQ